MKLAVICSMLLIMLSALVFADAPSAATTTPPEVFLVKGGDRVSGVIQKFEDGNVYLTSKFIGEIKLPWENVLGVESSRLLYFRLENGNIVAARALGLVNGKQILDSPIAGRIELNRDQVLIVGLSEEGVNPDYLAMQKEMKDTKEALRKATEIGELWSGYLNISFSGSSGNNDAVTFAGIAHAERAAESDKFVAHLDARYGRSDTDITAQEISGYLRENVNVTSMIYVYRRLEGKWDETKDIDFSFLVELGGGLHLLKEGDFEMFKGDKITLDWDLGATYMATDYEKGTDIHSTGATTRLTYNQVFSNKWHLYLMGAYIQGFKEPQNKQGSGSLANYKLQTEALLEIPLSEVLSFTASIKDEYINAPAPGRQRNDFYWLLGLKINL